MSLYILRSLDYFQRGQVHIHTVSLHGCISDHIITDVHHKLNEVSGTVRKLFRKLGETYVRSSQQSLGAAL